MSTTLTPNAVPIAIKNPKPFLEYVVAYAMKLSKLKAFNTFNGVNTLMTVADINIGLFPNVYLLQYKKAQSLKLRFF